MPMNSGSLGAGLSTIGADCRLGDVHETDGPSLIDLNASIQTTVLNPTLFLTQPSAFVSAETELHPEEVASVQLGRTPRIWLRDTSIGGLWPFLVSPSHEALIRRLSHTGTVPAGLSRSEIEVFRKSTLLVLPDELTRRQQAGENQAEEAANHYQRQGWCILQDLLHPAHLTTLARRYSWLIQSGRWSLGDKQVARRYSWRNEPSAKFFHHQLTDYLSLVLGTRIRPSYTFVCCYQGNATLSRHTDREECEFTLSLAVDSNPGPSWPLKLHTPTGTESISCRPGQAVLFGRELPHSRDQLPAHRTWTTILFQYVKA
jgi:hypothetical protein